MEQTRQRGVAGRAKWPHVLTVIAGALAGGCIAVVAVAPAADESGQGPTAAVQERHQARAARRVGVSGASRQAGNDYLIEVVPVLDSLQSAAGVASADFHVEVDNLRDAQVGVGYAWSMVDDMGNKLAEASGPAVGSLPAGGVYQSESWSLPKLHDGFYRVSITVVTAGARPELGTTLVRDWWLEVAQAHVQELTSSEWYSRAPGAPTSEEMK